KGDQFLRVPANVVGIRPAGVDPQVAAVAPAQLPEGLCQRREPRLSFRIVRRHVHDNTHATNAASLLRVRGERPRGRCTTDQSDELASPHSITSSARASTGVGISSPSVLAVFRLITSWYLVGAC